MIESVLFKYEKCEIDVLPDLHVNWHMSAYYNKVDLLLKNNNLQVLLMASYRDLTAWPLTVFLVKKSSPLSITISARDSSQIVNHETVFLKVRLAFSPVPDKATVCT